MTQPDRDTETMPVQVERSPRTRFIKNWDWTGSLLLPAAGVAVALLLLVGTTWIRYADLSFVDIATPFIVDPLHSYRLVFNVTSGAKLETTERFSQARFNELCRGDARKKIDAALGPPLLEYVEHGHKVLSYSEYGDDAWWVDVEIWLDNEGRLFRKVYRVRYD